MEIKIRVQAAAMVMAMSFLLLPGVSQALTLKQMPLVGLKGVWVLVEDMKPEAERLGLTRDQIKTDVELRLRKAGVRVLAEEEALKTLGNPQLYVKVRTVFESGICVFNITVELNEWVTLASGFGTAGEVWGTDSLGTVRTYNISRLRERVGDLVDKFINDYLAANPK